jgi:putative DNA primase/helicase
MASQAALRDAFLKKHPHVRFGLGEWREYKDGIWQAINELDVKNRIQTIVQSSNGTRLSSGIVTSIAELLKQRTHLPDRIFDYNPNILVFNNSCLDLLTYTAIPHSPEHYATQKLKFDYDPEARSEAWDAAAESFPHVDVLQRFAGLALTTETKYEVALWLHGPPGGGKSTFIAGIESMLGHRACVLGLDDLSRSNFALSQIPGKTLAISTEQPAIFVKCAHKLNSLISGESVVIEEKFQPRYTIQPRVKILWAMNELPVIPSGAGAGLFRRIYPILWPAIPETERKPEIKDEIMRSGMAIVNWSLEGLKRLQEAQRFDIPAELAGARDAYREQGDVTFSFVSDCCDEGDEIESAVLYENYSTWCVKNGHHPLAANRFAVDLERLGFSRARKKTGQYWKNLTLKFDSDDSAVH